MNYRNIYKQLILKRIKEPASLFFDYTLNHHIIPRSYKPELSNNLNNIVNLSAREHFIAHALLVKIAKQLNNIILYQKMLHAFNIMTTFKKNMMNDELYRKFDACISKLYLKWRILRSKIIHLTGCLKGIKGKYITICNELLDKQTYLKEGEVIPEGWKRGKLLKYTKARIQAIKEGKVKNTKGTRKIYNLTTFLMKNINQDLLLPEGWAYGLNPKTKLKIINPVEGKQWITNLLTYEYNLINKNEDIPLGWIKGKVTKLLENIEDVEYTFKTYTVKLWNKLTEEEKVKVVNLYYIFYKKYGWQTFQLKYNYHKWDTTLLRLFRKYLKK